MIIITSAREVAAHIDDKTRAVLSIADVGSERPTLDQNAYDLCTLSFDDIEDERDGEGPTIEHVRRIIEWAERIDLPTFIDADDENVVVHCFAGISRSTAAVFIGLVACGVKEARAARYLRDKCVRTANRISPNARMIKLADGHFGFGGSLSRVVDAAGLGHDREIITRLGGW